MKKASLLHIIPASLLALCLGPQAAASDATETSSGDEPEQRYISTIIQIDDEDFDTAISGLEERGAIILHTRGDMALAFIPEGGLTEVRKAKGIRHTEPRRKVNLPTMDHARQWHDASKIHEGEMLPQPFDGSGVIFGLCDTGMDPMHPDFRAADGRTSRVSRVFYYDEDDGTRYALTTPDEIASWGTDNPDMYHASHVAGIAAGSYANGYQGMAPGAEIVFAGTRYLTDACILAGVEDMLAYAREQGRPLVVNLSLGNYTGPHDGTSLFNRYLDLIAEECVVCMSAGNEGSVDISLQHTFTEQQPEVIVKSADWDGLNPEALTEIWSLDDTPFLYNLNLWESAKKNYNYPQIDFTQRQEPWRISADPGDPDYDETFASYYNSGYVEVTGGISPLNGRFYVSIYHKCSTDVYDPASATNPGGRWALCWLANRVASDVPGTHVDMYVDGQTAFFRQCGKYPTGNPSQSISDLACGYNTLSVGMYNNRSEVPLTDGSTFSQNVTPGEVSSLSSYGTLNDGRVFPHTVAPGYMVVSAANTAYLEKYPSEVQYTNASIDMDGKTYYYMTEWGTSMSCPYVAGTIATWLQAYPQLTSAEVKEIISRTNTHDYPSPEKPHNGQGHFMPYLGMSEVIKLAALEVEDITVRALAVSMRGRTLVVENASGQPAEVRVHALGGALLRSHRLTDAHSEISLHDLPAGVYAVSVESATGHSKTTKIIL